MTAIRTAISRIEQLRGELGKAAELVIDSEDPADAIDAAFLRGCVSAYGSALAELRSVELVEGAQ